jgi:hypothetical protein
MPVILTTPREIETWMTAPAEEALKLQRPLPDDVLAIVARGERKDESLTLAYAVARPIAVPSNYRALQLGCCVLTIWLASMFENQDANCEERLLCFRSASTRATATKEGTS